MTNSRDPVRRLARFDDLAQVDDEVLRQLGARVHIMDLAYAFGSGDPALLDRLYNAVRPGLAAEIRSGTQIMETERARYPLDEQVRTARSRVLEIARGMVEEEGPGARGMSGERT